MTDTFIPIQPKNPPKGATAAAQPILHNSNSFTDVSSQSTKKRRHRFCDTITEDEIKTAAKELRIKRMRPKDDKRTRRMAANRISAKKSRERRRMLSTRMEDLATQLRQRNATLCKERQELRLEIAQLRKMKESARHGAHGALKPPAQDTKAVPTVTGTGSSSDSATRNTGHENHEKGSNSPPSSLALPAQSIRAEPAASASLGNGAMTACELSQGQMGPKGHTSPALSTKSTLNETKPSADVAGSAAEALLRMGVNGTPSTKTQGHSGIGGLLDHHQLQQQQLRILHGQQEQAPNMGLDAFTAAQLLETSLLGAGLQHYQHPHNPGLSNAVHLHSLVGTYQATVDQARALASAASRTGVAGGPSLEGVSSAMTATARTSQMSPRPILPLSSVSAAPPSSTTSNSFSTVAALAQLMPHLHLSLGQNDLATMLGLTAPQRSVPAAYDPPLLQDVHSSLPHQTSDSLLLEQIAALRATAAPTPFSLGTTMTHAIHHP